MRANLKSLKSTPTTVKVWWKNWTSKTCITSQGTTGFSDVITTLWLMNIKINHWEWNTKKRDHNSRQAAWHIDKCWGRTTQLWSPQWILRNNPSTARRQFSTISLARKPNLEMMCTTMQFTLASTVRNIKLKKTLNRTFYKARSSQPMMWKSWP